MDIRHVDIVDPARRTVLRDRRIRIREDRIVAVEHDDGAAPIDDDLDASGLFAIPGLIDAHVHLASVSADEWADTGLSPSLVSAHAFREMGRTLRRGFTTVRDAGGADIGFAQARDLGLISGPRVFTCGRALSQTGGHADLRPRGRFRVDADPWTPGIGLVVDGTDQMRRSVREIIRQGATFVKLMVSGGVSSPSDRIDHLQFSDAEIAAAVDEAERAGLYCAAHAYTADAVTRAVDLGCRSIEHGNLLTRESARAIVRAGAFLVPTMITYDVLAEEGVTHGLPPESVRKIDDVRHGSREALRAARHEGAAIAFGTDLLGDMRHRQNEEFALRASVEESWDVLASATIVGAELLQRTGELGVITDGAFADIVLTRHNPGEHIELLADPAREISRVFIGGREAA